MQVYGVLLRFPMLFPLSPAGQMLQVFGPNGIHAGQPLSCLDCQTLLVILQGFATVHLKLYSLTALLLASE